MNWDHIGAIVRLDTKLILTENVTVRLGIETSASSGVNFPVSDINECVDGSHMCDSETSECLNRMGHYDCRCLPGYRMNMSSVNVNNKTMSSFICEGQ